MGGQRKIGRGGQRKIGGWQAKDWGAAKDWGGGIKIERPLKRKRVLEEKETKKKKNGGREKEEGSKKGGGGGHQKEIFPAEDIMAWSDQFIFTIK